jgi:hypothetical protein
MHTQVQKQTTNDRNHNQKQQDDAVDQWADLGAAHHAGT